MAARWAPVAGLALITALGCDFQTDLRDARALADRIHAQMRAGDYASIYKESAPRFKSVGTEAQFVLLMQDFRRHHGQLKAANEIGYQVGVESTAGKVHVLTFEVKFDIARAREHMTVTRSDSGAMLLWKLEIEPPTTK
jgi:hypothetical protein